MARQKNDQKLRILFLSAEADPFVKVGGLGDVAGALPGALRKLDPQPAGGSRGEDSRGPGALDIRLIIPFYPEIDQQTCNLRPVTTFNLQTAAENLPVVVYGCVVKGVPVYLISGPPINVAGPVYSGDPLIDGRKFIFFSLAALELARSLGWKPDILHANDWHTAPAVYALSLKRRSDPFFSQTACLLSIHNLPYLGVGTAPVMTDFGLPPAEGSPLPWWAKDIPLPLGLLTADRIVAVSPTYAQEILTPEFGSGLYEFLQTRRGDISGILNGLDAELWNPATDPALPRTFSLAELPARRVNKAALQAELGLAQEPETPLIGMVTRLDNQKGVDLAIEALRQLASAETPWQAVLLGTGLVELEEAARQLQAEFPERVRAVIAFDAPLSRRIYGGADLLLIPSRYEPCGLTQMIAMRYGCVPVARATGGLKDTIQDYHASGPASKLRSTGRSRGGNGFLFETDSPAALAAAVRRALDVYADKRRWRSLQRQGMRQDFSWERSARKYLELYQALASLEDKPGRAGQASTNASPGQSGQTM